MYLTYLLILLFQEEDQRYERKGLEQEEDNRRSYSLREMIDEGASVRLGHKRLRTGLFFSSSSLYH